MGFWDCQIEKSFSQPKISYNIPCTPSKILHKSWSPAGPVTGALDHRVLAGYSRVLRILGGGLHRIFGEVDGIFGK